jgi:outer membrane protein assembly factor BamB
MGSTRRLRTAVVAGLAVVVWAQSGAVLARAQDDGLVRTATILPYLAQSVEQAQPNVNFGGADLAIAADARKNPVKQAFLRFSLGALPRGARITAWTLRLELATPGQGLQEVRAFPATFDWSLATRTLPRRPLTWNTRPQVSTRGVGKAEVTADVDPVDIPLTLPEREPWIDVGKGDVSLMLQAVNASADYAYHGLCPRGATAPCPTTNRQPRLIVRYAMPPAAAPIEWPQPGHDAQHSRQTVWRPSAAVAAVASRTVYAPREEVADAPKGYIVGAPAMTDGRLFLHTQRDDAGSKKFFLTVVDESGRLAWQRDLPGAAKFPPFLDRTGRVRVVTENSLVSMPASGPTFSVPPSPWSELLEPGSSVSVREPPTVGASGALYLSTDRGVFALGPDQRVWWKVGSLEARAGPVALSPDETTAYVVLTGGPAAKDDRRCLTEGGAGGPGPANPAGVLVAIDTVSGRVRWRAGAFDQPADGTALPVPVVTTVEVQGEKGRETRTLVYAVDGHQRGRSLQVFDGQTGQCVTVSTAGFFSRPVVVGEGAVALVRREEKDAKGRLCRYAWAPGSDLQWTCPQGDEDLSPLSVLAADGNGSVYAIDGTSSPQKIRGYDRDLVRRLRLDVPETRFAAEEKSTNLGDNVLVGADGTLFATNRNALFVIAPTKVAESAPEHLVLDADGVKGTSPTAFLAQKSITVGQAENGARKVEIGAVQSIVLRSGGGILFRPGFTVHRGARVLARTGMAQP